MDKLWTWSRMGGIYPRIHLVRAYALICYLCFPFLCDATNRKFWLTLRLFSNKKNLQGVEISLKTLDICKLHVWKMTRNPLKMPFLNKGAVKDIKVACGYGN